MAAVESKTTELRKDVDQMDNSLSFLNKEVQELRSKEIVQLQAGNQELGKQDPVPRSLQSTREPSTPETSRSQ